MSARPCCDKPKRTLALLPALITALAACTTTGDPTQGGLFGWSEAKAQQREAELAQQSAAARQDATDAQRNAQTLNRQRDTLAAESSRLQKELDGLLAENTGLDAKLRTLMQQKGVGATELVRLQKVVADNDRVRRSLKAPAPAPAAQLAPKAPTTAQVAGVSEQNDRLHREIMILMQR